MITSMMRVCLITLLLPCGSKTGDCASTDNVPSLFSLSACQLLFLLNGDAFTPWTRKMCPPTFHTLKQCPAAAAVTIPEEDLTVRIIGQN